MKKTLFSLSMVAMAASASAAAPADNVTINPWRFEYSGYVSNVSQNGLWVTGQPRAGVTFDKLQVVDAMKGKIMNLPIKKWYSANGTEVDVLDGISVVSSAVSEDGKLVGGTYYDLPGYWKDETWYNVEFPNGRGGEFMKYTTAVVTNIRGEGKYMVGYAYNEAFDIKPMFWIDGKLQSLEGLPQRDWKGHWVVEHLNDKGEKEAPEGNMMFLDVSNDGRWLFGGMSTNHPGWGCCYFVYDIKNKTYDIIGLSELNELIGSGKYFEETELMGDVPPHMSQNGKYIVGNVMLCEDNGSQFPTEHKLPYTYDIEKKKFTIYNGKAHEGIATNGITNDGDICGVSNAESPARSVVFLRNGVWYTLESILEQVYGINYNVATGFEGLSGTPFGISYDGMSIVAMSPGSEQETYFVNLEDQTFFEAADGVNLLKNYTIAPSTGANIARFDELVIRFERNVEIQNAKAQIVDENGNTVASDGQIGRPANVTDSRYVSVKFAETKFENGKKYTVKVPESAFKLEESDVYSGEINVTYIGREETPVTPSSISPIPGSNVRELGVNNMIYIPFSSTIQAAANAKGMLYQEGNDTPLASLNITSDGVCAYVYPTVTTYLRKGLKYIVKVPAGSILDITGYCPNEDIEIEYTGSYVRTNAGNVLFEDDFSTPGESLGSWLLYDGDKLKPSAEMESYGFDAENTPWNFSIEDGDGLYDYCAAAHSTFATPGKADDWMVTPQINVSNSFIFLDFDAQNFKNNKNDKLKVVVWPCDDVYGAVDKSIIDRMKAEGTVLAELTLEPGANESTLAGDWKHYQYSLGQFAGKNVYVAFVNENENQSMIFVDNVKIEFRGNFRAGTEESEYAVDKENMDITGYVAVINEITYNSIKAELSNEDGSFTSVYEKDGLNLGQGDIYNFTFPEALPLKKGELNRYKIVVTMGEEQQTAASQVYNLLFQPEKRVVVEEGTGTWCGNCPRGIIALEDLEHKFGNNVIPVSIHNNDIMAYESYLQFLGINAFPSGRVNRRPDMLSPTSVVNGMQSFTSEAGNETFHDIVMKEFAEPALAEIKVNSAEALASGVINIEAEVNFAVNATEQDFNVLLVLLEDNIGALQTSYIAGSQDPLYGEWGLGGKYDAAHPFFNFVDVARGIAGSSFYGQAGLVPETVEANVPYKSTIEMRIPRTVNNIANTKLVAMLLNNSTGRIVNANRFEDIDVSGVEAVEAELVAAKFTVSNGEILLNGSAQNVMVYTLDGRKVNNENLANGLYIARGIAGDKVATAKILIKK